MCNNLHKILRTFENLGKSDIFRGDCRNDGLFNSSCEKYQHVRAKLESKTLNSTEFEST